MSREIGRYGWKDLARGARPVFLLERWAIGVAVLARKAAAGRRSRLVAAAVLSALIGLGGGQLTTWLAAHVTVSTYIAFIPGNMENAGVTHQEIRAVTARAVMEGLHRLLQDYDRRCQEHRLEADARKIDCDRVHKMSEEPIPEN